MGELGGTTNKALLPVDRIAALSHIFSKFPKGTEFVVALGYLGQHVRDYVRVAHTKTGADTEARVTFVEVQNSEGPGSGPGESLLACAPHLQRPFFFVTCDTLWDGEIDLSGERDWLGVAPVNAEDSASYCNLKIENGRAVALRDKQRVDESGFRAFVGLAHVKSHEAFWRGLRDGALVAGEKQLSPGLAALVNAGTAYAHDIAWRDIGTIDRYKSAVLRHEPFDFSKTNECFYVIGGKVIKYFADADITAKRVRKAALNAEAFPAICDHVGNFMAYRYISGQTLYERNSPALFEKLLVWLERSLWRPVAVERATLRSTCELFYQDKTSARLTAYHQKFGPSLNTINGVAYPSDRELFARVDWSKLFDGRTVFMHGDLQFDNILHDDASDRFTLLDWRQDFGGYIEWGDLYYDLAKLYGGILINYAEIKRNHFEYEESADGAIKFSLPPQNEAAAYTRVLERFVSDRGLDFKRVRLLGALIYLNMSPLHHAPFSKALHALGRKLLAEVV